MVSASPCVSAPPPLIWIVLKTQVFVVKRVAPVNIKVPGFVKFAGGRALLAPPPLKSTILSFAYVPESSIVTVLPLGLKELVARFVGAAGWIAVNAPVTLGSLPKICILSARVSAPQRLRPLLAILTQANALPVDVTVTTPRIQSLVEPGVHVRPVRFTFPWHRMTAVLDALNVPLPPPIVPITSRLVALGVVPVKLRVPPLKLRLPNSKLLSPVVIVPPVLIWQIRRERRCP